MLKQIESAEQAVARANALTGLNALFMQPKSPLPQATPMRLQADDTPFPGERNVGKPVWRVDYPTTSIAFESAARNARDRYPRNFTAWINAATGALFYVECPYAGDPDPDMRPMPDCGVATAQLSAEAEVYAGYPELDPLVNFFSALERTLNGGIGSPFVAKSIYAALVLHSRMGADPKPAWAITFNGIPPMPARGPHADRVPVWQRNHIRNVIDANTGVSLFATTSPQPK